MSEAEQRHHYYLFSCEISYARIETTEDMRSKTTYGTKKANCISRMSEQQVNRPQIAMAQHIVHKQFMDSVAKDSASYHVGEIFIHGFSYMGHMTEAESSPPIPTSIDDAMKAFNE